ncbi:Hypothetical protein ACI5QL_01070 [Bacillus velezensis]
MHRWVSSLKRNICIFSSYHKNGQNKKQDERLRVHPDAEVRSFITEN